MKRLINAVYLRDAEARTSKKHYIRHGGLTGEVKPNATSTDSERGNGIEFKAGAKLLYYQCVTNELEFGLVSPF